MERWILHVDMDAFYASVEQRDRPELRGQPVVVGGSPDSRGVVAAASYEARSFGIHSAMSASRARRLCPNAVFLRPDFAKYTAVSRQIREVFRRVTPRIEPLALDEAYLDVTAHSADEAAVRQLARQIKDWIAEDTQLVASAGGGPNKLIAKLASDHDKPDGLWVVAPTGVDAFLLPLPVKRLWGVGPKTAYRLQEMGVETVEDVRRQSPERLEHQLGKYGPFLWDLAHGRDERPVVDHRVAKSHGAERTLGQDLRSRRQIERLIDDLSERVASDLTRSGRPGRTVTLKLRYNDFTTITRSRSRPTPTHEPARIAVIAKALLDETEAGRRPVRLVGVQVSGLVDEDEPYQLELAMPDGDS
ncbi:MAG: DNA polymerase IV [Myxococcota bacterium]